MTFAIEFTPDAWEHLQEFSARDQTILLDAVETQLCYEPNQETRNRKLLQNNPLATWELRVGKFRVFYDIENNSLKIVYIVAIGYKEHNQLFIRAKRFNL